MTDSPIVVLTQEQLAKTVREAVADALRAFAVPTAAAPTKRSELLTIREVAELLRTTPKTVRNWMNSDRFPKPRRVGGHALRWPRTEVEKYLEQRR